MHSINIYALSGIPGMECAGRYERQMSARENFLAIKRWEINDLLKLTGRLWEHAPVYGKYSFFYSFQFPKLGKEFDLLQITEDTVLNIELKSQAVSDERIRKQLLQNRHYLMTLGKQIYSFTYISKEDRLVRLSKSGRLVEASWEELAERLADEKECVCENVEVLFREDKYLISPLTDPNRFLRRDYFLTSQQRDIRRKILSRLDKEKAALVGFTGLPGTGKTLLLYDLAMELSARQRVNVLHFGSFPEELLSLDARLKRIEFCPCQGKDPGEIFEKMLPCAAICVDEGHRMTSGVLDALISYAGERQVPVVFCYDREESLCPEEREKNPVETLDSVAGYEKYSLTNRIRTNSQLSVFIQNAMNLSGRHRRMRFEDVDIAYACDFGKEEILRRNYQEKGYIYIHQQGENRCKGETRVDGEGLGNGETQGNGETRCNGETRGNEENRGNRENCGEDCERDRGKDWGDKFLDMDFSQATCKEFEKVLVVIDESYYYDDRGYLRCRRQEGAGDYPVRDLYHGMCRAKNSIAIIVRNNAPVFEKLLSVLQGPERS